MWGDKVRITGENSGEVKHGSLLNCPGCNATHFQTCYVAAEDDRVYCRCVACQMTFVLMGEDDSTPDPNIK
jgi:transcription elongation factor Elf1